ncbi:MAG: discoidin domain-containing protein [Candidatus Sericytochromatia bacterium]|nr:discoidin domain-containing protein [Candidatus Sericytochromatia bacterium]
MSAHTTRLPLPCRSRPAACLLAAALIGWLPTPALGAGPEVLAVTASSTDGMLMDAVDGDEATAWQNRREGERTAWLAVRFVRETRLRGVELTLDAPQPDVTLDLETSRDGERFTPALTGLHGGGAHVFRQPVAALYLRVRFAYTGSGQAPRFRLRELVPLGG